MGHFPASALARNVISHVQIFRVPAPWSLPRGLRPRLFFSASGGPVALGVLADPVGAWLLRGPPSCARAPVGAGLSVGRSFLSWLSGPVAPRCFLRSFPRGLRPPPRPARSFFLFVAPAAPPDFLVLLAPKSMKKPRIQSKGGGGGPPLAESPQTPSPDPPSTSAAAKIIATPDPITP